MNILVTGANGQLGNELRIVAKGSADKYIFTDVLDATEESIAMLQKLAGDDICHHTEHLDITDIETIRQIVKEQDVDVIVNCAAFTNVDKAEANPELAELLNAKAVENLAIAVKEVNGMLLHISTDYVFGGDQCNTPIKEEHKVAPTSVYGLAKLHGEEAIQRVGCKHIIIRTAWLYSEFGKNFVKTMLHLTATKPQLKVVFDQVGCPTYAYDLARVILHLLLLFVFTPPALRATSPFHGEEYLDSCPSPKAAPLFRGAVSLLTEGLIFNSQFSILNFSSDGVTSWYDFAQMIANMAGNTACDIQPCHSDEYPSPVKRPAYSVLDKAKIKEAFNVEIPYWIDSLKICISNKQVITL